MLNEAVDGGNENLDWNGFVLRKVVQGRAVGFAAKPIRVRI